MVLGYTDSMMEPVKLDRISVLSFTIIHASHSPPAVCEITRQIGLSSLDWQPVSEKDNYDFKTIYNNKKRHDSSEPSIRMNAYTHICYIQQFKKAKIIFIYV